MPRRTLRATLGVRPHPAPHVPSRLLLLALVAALPAAAQPGVAELRSAGAAELAVGSDSVAATRLGRAARLDRRHAPTHLAHALALADLDRAASRRALDRAERHGPELPSVHAARLRDLRQPPAAKLYSMVDARRARAARRLLALDSTAALAHAELAERAIAAFRYHRVGAKARGVWSRDTWAGRRAWSAFADAERHLDALLALDARSQAAHRLAARLAILADSAAAFDAAARRALAARPFDPDAWMVAAAAGWRAGDAARADSLARVGLARLGPSASRYTSAARFVRPDDRAAWDADSSAWRDTFWAARDASRLRPGNDRWLEHVARLVEANLLFRLPGSAVPGWATDRGDTWVRFGPPTSRRWWLQTALEGEPGEYERWRYPEFSLTFMDPWMRGDMEFRSSAAGEDDATRARSLANRFGEQYDPAAGRRRAGVALSVSALRGADGRADLVIGYGVPVAGAGAPPAVRSVAWARAQDGAVLDEAAHADPAPSGEAVLPGADVQLWAHGTTLAVPPGPLALVAETELLGAFGVAELQLDVRAFGGPGLETSDLVLAAHVAEADEPPPPGAVRRGELWVRPLPVAAVATDAPLWAYLEVYGLGQDASRTRFEVEARLEPVAEGGALRRGLRRLLGRERRGAVAAAVTSEGTAPDDAVALLLDVTDQRPGLYRLTLAVHDRVAGTRAQATRTLLLDPPR